MEGAEWPAQPSDWILVTTPEGALGGGKGEVPLGPGTEKGTLAEGSARKMSLPPGSLLSPGLS